MRRIVLMMLALAAIAASGTAKDSEPVVLTSKDAIIQGKARHYREEGFIGRWHRPKDEIQFYVSPLEKGKYKVHIIYGAPGENGGKVQVKLNDEEFEDFYGDTGGWEVQRKKKIGNIKHPGGSMDIRLNITEQRREDEAVINVFSIIFEKR